MSSILKALRKLEEEKAALGDGGVDIARDILKRSARKPHNLNFWPLLSGVLFLLLIGSALFFWSERPSDVGVVEPADTVVTPVAIIPPALKQAQPVATEIVPVEKVRDLPATLALPSEEPTAEATAAVPRVNVGPEALLPNGLPYLNLNGIAYREKPAERIAIINDLPVMQGTAIEGAELLEIHPDRVVLSWRGTRFELRIAAED